LSADSPIRPSSLPFLSPSPPGTAVGAGAIAFGITEAKAEGGIYDMIFGSSSGPSGEWVAVAKEIKDILEDDVENPK